jgi:ADP-ribose pyrophosphatase
MGVVTQPDGRPPIEMLREREVYANRFVTVYDDDVVIGGNRNGNYLRIVESGGLPGVAMLATCNGRVALVRTYRYALSAWEWGVPRGFAHGADPAVSALGELREELGGTPEELVPLGVVTPNSALLTARVHLFHAVFADAVADPEDVDEVAEVRWVDRSTLFADIAAQRIVDGFTMSVVAAALAAGRLDHLR